ncbi:MAG: cell surface protein, partial [Lachnospiraceae bacterium]
QVGALYTGQWLNYGGIGTTDGSGGSGLESAVSGRSYSDYPEMWMYFGADSKKYRSRGGSPLQKEIGGATYGFDENGIMLSWWGDIASLSDAVRSNPTTVQSVKYYDGYDGGPRMKNKWLWMFPSEKLS